MTREHDFIGLVEEYLDEHGGNTPLPDAARNAIRAQLPSTQQRPAWWPARRIPEMNSMIRTGLAAAAVVIVAALGIGVAARDVGISFDVAPTDSPAPNPEAVIRHWIDAINRADLDGIRSPMAERVTTGEGPNRDADDVAEYVADRWCPMALNSIEASGNEFLVTATFRDDADGTCTDGAPGTSGTFVVEVRDGLITRIP